MFRWVSCSLLFVFEGDLTNAPSDSSSAAPTLAPSVAPTLAPSSAPSLAPTLAPSSAPSQPPTAAPTQPPTNAPSSTQVAQLLKTHKLQGLMADIHRNIAQQPTSTETPSRCSRSIAAVNSAEWTSTAPRRQGAKAQRPDLSLLHLAAGHGRVHRLEVKEQVQSKAEEQMCG